MLVVAGAGSGKTRVLTERIVRLVRDCGASPSSLFAVTFTNKAAREMRARVEARLGQEVRGIWLSTFHSLCARLLRIEGHRMGLAPNFVIYDENDQLQVVREVALSLDLHPELYPPGRLLRAIGRAKTEGRSPRDLPASDPSKARIASVYEAYQRRLSESGALDFDDLLLLPLRLFRENPDVLARYRERFRYVLVDEFQDTNRVQYRLVRLLAEEHRNLFAVGDDDQSIYRWRGADLRNILQFERDFPDARIFRLEQNYRSTATILAAAGAVISHNLSRHPKNLWTHNPPGEPIRLHAAEDERAEARFVVREILALRAKGHAYSDIAVFYRTNAQSRALEEELVRQHVPYRLVGSLRFYDRKEVKDLLAYLRVLANPDDELSLARILNVPPRGIGKTTSTTLQSTARAKGRRLFDLVLDPTPTGLAPPVARRVESFGSLLRRWSALAPESGVAPLLRTIVEETGYTGRLDDGSEEAAARLENVREFLGFCEEFDASYGGTLTEFLEQVALVADVDELPEQNDRLVLMTVHNSKGLEFPVVFVTGCEEGLFPHDRSSVDPEGLEEERRLFYVALTRARRRVFLSYAERRALFGRTGRALPSRFLREVPSELLAPCEEGATDSREVRVDRSDSQLPEEPPWVAASPRPAFPVGTRIRHATFGVGVVRKLEGSGEGTKALVHFREAGLKKLVLRLAPIERVDDEV